MRYILYNTEHNTVFLFVIFNAMIDGLPQTTLLSESGYETETNSSDDVTDSRLSNLVKVEVFFEEFNFEFIKERVAYTV